MKYKSVKRATFQSRPNRFIAKVLLEDGREETVHVKNTGRCRELLVPDCTVYLEKSDNENRKTAFDLIAVEKKSEGGTILINMDSQVVNTAAEEWLRGGTLFSKEAEIRREVTYKSSRFDFCITEGGKKSFLEVKGVTLERDKKALFPDAPTERGVKHLRELIACKKEGFGAYVLFVIQMKGISSFSPNEKMHPEFAKTLRECADCGVEVLAYDCIITPDSIKIDSPVEVIL